MPSQSTNLTQGLESIQNKQAVKARLSLYDGSEYYEFLVQPEEIAEGHQGNYAELPVLYTGQPLVSYQYSRSTITLPTVRFYTQANSENLEPILKKLQDWTKPHEQQFKPRLLKFLWGSVEYPRVYLQSFQFKREQMRGGNCTQATGSMTLLNAPEPPKAIVDPDSTSLTEREQNEYGTKVEERLKADPALRERLKVDRVEDVEVGQDGQVSVAGTGIGALPDVIGREGLRPGLANLGKQEPANNSEKPK